MCDTYSQTYYQRNREWILQKIKEKNANKENQDKIREYQQKYFEKNVHLIKKYQSKYREEHHDELAQNSRDTYRASVLEEVGRIVVPTAHKIDATGIEIRVQKRLSTIGNTIHKRHLIQRNLEINRIKSEQFKKLLSFEKNLAVENSSGRLSPDI